MAWTVRRVDVTEYTEEEAGMAYLAVGLAESPDLDGQYLEFQLATDEDEREDGFCLVDGRPEHGDAHDLMAVALACAAHRTVYGGVTACSLDGDQLTFTLTAEAQHVFALPAVLELDLDLSKADKALLRQGLSEVLSVVPAGAVPVIVDL